MRPTPAQGSGGAKPPVHRPPPAGFGAEPRSYFLILSLILNMKKAKEAAETENQRINENLTLGRFWAETVLPQITLTYSNCFKSRPKLPGLKAKSTTAAPPLPLTP